MISTIKDAVQLVRQGSNEGKAYLYEETYKKAYYVALKYMRNEDDSCDVIQDAYIKAFDRIAQLKDDNSFESWLNSIVASTALDALKKKKPQLFTDISEDGDFDVAEKFEADYSYQPEVVIDKNETTRLVQEIIDELSDEQRVCVTMYYIQEMSIKEISGILDVSKNTVMSRLNYARKNIEKKVKELEKKGTKLYALAPIPFLIFLIGKEADACDASAVAGLFASGGTGASAGATVGATAKTMTLGTKIAIGIVSAAVVIGGAVGAGIIAYNNADDSTNETVESPSNEVKEQPQETKINSREALTNYYDTALVQQYGMADPDMSVKYVEDDDMIYQFQGFTGKPGIMGKKFVDIDNDGVEEMLVSVCDYLNPDSGVNSGKVKQIILLYKLDTKDNQVKEITEGKINLESYTGFNDTIQCAYRIVDGLFYVYFTKVHWNTLTEGGLFYCSATIFSFDGNNVAKLISPSEEYEQIGSGKEAIRLATPYMPTIVEAWEKQFPGDDKVSLANSMKNIAFSQARDSVAMFKSLARTDPEYKDIFTWEMMRKRTDDYKEYGPDNGIVYGYWNFYE